MRTALFLLTLCIHAIYAFAQSSGVLTSTVQSQLPVFVNGDRLDPHNGVHEFRLFRDTGLMVDGVLYLPVSKTPPYVPSTRADGMHYACEGAWRAAGAAFDSTGDRSLAKRAMLAFWQREFGDSLIVTQSGEWDFELSRRGDVASGPIIISLACFNGSGASGCR